MTVKSRIVQYYHAEWRHPAQPGRRQNLLESRDKCREVCVFIKMVCCTPAYCTDLWNLGNKNGLLLVGKNIWSINRDAASLEGLTALEIVNPNTDLNSRS